MKLLLDTHIWLWQLVEPKKLGAKGQRIIEAGNNALWLSPISIWELGLLIDHKRFKIDVPFERWVQQSIDASQVEEAAMTNEVALALRYIQTAHNDPADRLIAATAAVYDLTLLTADERLLEGRGYKHVSPHS